MVVLRILGQGKCPVLFESNSEEIRPPKMLKYVPTHSEETERMHFDPLLKILATEPNSWNLRFNCITDLIQKGYLIFITLKRSDLYVIELQQFVFNGKRKTYFKYIQCKTQRKNMKFSWQTIYNVFLIYFAIYGHFEASYFINDTLFYTVFHNNRKYSWIV